MAGSASGSRLIAGFFFFRSFLMYSLFHCFLQSSHLYLFLISCNYKNFYQNKSDNMHKSIIFMTACLIALYEFLNCHIMGSILMGSAWKEVAEENVWA